MCCTWSGALNMLPRGPKIMQIPRGDQKKCSLCRKSANPFGAIFIEFGDTNKCCTFSGLELVPKSRKKLIGALSCTFMSVRSKFQFHNFHILVQRPQHNRTSDSTGEPKTNHFNAILIEFGDTKKCYTFTGLELVPKSSKKLIGGLSCMHKGQKCIQILWDR